jgi:hypothetical protein
MFRYFSPPSLFAPSPNTTIVESLRAIDLAVTNLNTALLAWNGSVAASWPILATSCKLVTDLKARTQTARLGPHQTVEEAQTCVDEALKLTGSLEMVIGSTIARRDDASSILIRPVVLHLLKMLRDAAADFSRVVVDKMPLEMEALMETVMAVVDEVFELGIRAYSVGGK